MNMKGGINGFTLSVDLYECVLLCVHIDILVVQGEEIFEAWKNVVVCEYFSELIFFKVWGFVLVAKYDVVYMLNTFRWNIPFQF